MLDLFETSYKATIEYVSNNISNPMNRDSYLKESYYILNNLPNHKDLNTLYAFILRLSLENEVKIPVFYLFANPPKYSQLACEHAFDLIHSLNRKQGLVV